MARLTLRDKHTLRRMLAAACNHEYRYSESYIEAAALTKMYERTLAKIVPKGRLAPLRKPLTK